MCPYRYCNVLRIGPWIFSRCNVSDPLWLLCMIVPCWAVKMAIRYFVIDRVPLDPRRSMDFLWESKANKAKYSLKYKKLYHIGATPSPCRTDQKALTKFSLYVGFLHSNGTARDKVTVIGSLGQTNGTNKNPMWAGVNGTHQGKAVRDCESWQILKCDWEWNAKILMWACVTGTT